MKRRVSLLAAIILFAHCFPLPSRAEPAPVVIDFEGLQPALVFNQFASQGAIFNGPIVRDFSPTPGFTHSGNKAIELCFAQEFCSAPLTVSFTTGQAHAKLWVGYSAQLFQAMRVNFQALDGNGAQIGQTSVVLNASAGPIPIQTPLEINSPTPNIRTIILGFAAPPGQTAFNNGLVIDDVEFSTAGPAPPCNTTDRPAVALAQPPNELQTTESTVQTNEFILQGTVFTAVPLDEATLRVARPGGEIKSSDLLAGGIASRTGGTFGATRVNEALLPGTNKVSVLVRNCAGSGEDIATVVYNPIAPGTGFKFLGMEVTQATQDLNNSVPLVSNKPTIARLYLSVTGPTTAIFGVKAAITATPPAGSPLPPLLNSMNSITVDASSDVNDKRLSLNKSLNFLLPPEWTASRTLHLEVSKVLIQGAETNLPCDGCRNLDEIKAPRFVHFNPTKTLNLVLAPYEFSRAEKPTPDILFTPMGALQWVNNVYPLSGNFPSTSGIRILRMLPMRSTTSNLFSSDEVADFLDELQDLMNSLQTQSGNDWPSDAHLFGMVASGHGGAGVSPGNVAYGDTWVIENGLVPEENYEKYGMIWAQEIGHNFGRQHAGNSHGELPPRDLSFPSTHGNIGQPGLAISTEYWNGSPFLIVPGNTATGGRHAHDFMSYGALTGSHTYSWVSPYTYQALFKSLLDLSEARAAAPNTSKEKLVVRGRINMDGKVTLHPFNRVTSEFTSEPDPDGEFSINLVGAGGKTLLSYRFTPQHLGGTDLHGFNEIVPWKAGTQTILIKRRTTTVAKREVSSHAPWVRVISPRRGETWGAKPTITWEAGDDDKDSLTYTVLYNSGLDQIWLPLANGVTKPSVTIDTALLPGSPRARVRIRVTDGVNTTEADSDGYFAVPEKQPLVAILAPTNGQVLAPDVPPQLVGGAYDPEDGVLPAASLRWTSDRDGLIGQGQCPEMKLLSRGPHRITLTATDSQGNSVSARVNVVVSRERLRIR